MRRVVTIAAILMLAGPGNPAALTADPAWLEQLGDQAKLLERCEIDYIVRFQEGELGGRKFFEARIKCADGRMFDATRVGTIDFFQFKACEEVRVC